MVSPVRVTYNQAAMDVVIHGPQVQRWMYLLAGRATVRLKANCPVSPVYPTYADPLPVGYSRAQAYRARGKGLARRGGPVLSLRRLAGDLPLRPSGYLRNSIEARRVGTGWHIGPTADYGLWVDQGSLPRIIRSHGPWPLRNRATGQVFGPLVHHPGYHGAHFIQRTVDEMAARPEVFR